MGGRGTEINGDVWVQWRWLVAAEEGNKGSSGNSKVEIFLSMETNHCVGKRQRKQW